MICSNQAFSWSFYSFPWQDSNISFIRVIGPGSKISGISDKSDICRCSEELLWWNPSKWFYAPILLSAFLLWKSTSWTKLRILRIVAVSRIRDPNSTDLPSKSFPFCVLFFLQTFMCYVITALLCINAYSSRSSLQLNVNL